MTRMLRLALVFAIAALVWAPEIHAQQFPGVIGPSGTLAWNAASTTCSNSAAECSVFQYTIPAAYIATGTTVSALVSQYLDGRTSDGRNIPVLWRTPQPMHLSMAGILNGSAGTIFQTGINLGGTAASIGMSNTLVSAATFTPITLDVWIVPIASQTAPQSAANNVYMLARLITTGVGTQAATVTQTHVLTAMNLASPAQLNVLNRWQAAASTSSIVWFKRVLKVGE